MPHSGSARLADRRRGAPPSPAMLGRRTAYTAYQAVRVAWYAGHYALAFRSLASLGPPPWPVGPVPDRAALMRDLAGLFRRDLANMEACAYRAPIRAPSPWRELRRSRLFRRDLPVVDRRRQSREVIAATGDPALDEADLADLPAYFRQAFHFQTGGYLTAESAELYDMQVEVLFTGAAGAMRRQVLPEMRAALAGRPQRRLRLLDLACGTGRFTATLKDNWPGAQVTGLDLSPAYLEHARRRAGPRPRMDWRQGAAEDLPWPDGHFDAVSAVFLFHELPRKVRARVAAEMVRVTRPGGAIVLVDSLQKGDRPDWDGLLDLFPHGFHEPYFRDYVQADLPALFAPHGAALQTEGIAFLSKHQVFRRHG
ncbi:class I SAM-dependent methyltransferase [Marinibaculum pumilum]|uniref:Class I SAM-dependent methyltransferase n=1 Tax=Marinibaculum pumilum TaxID=1766165 RepID=A0ABV7LA49_9PROT